MSKCAKCKEESSSLRDFTSMEPMGLCPKCEKEWLKVFTNTFPNYKNMYPSTREWRIAWKDWLGIYIKPVKVVFT